MAYNGMDPDQVEGLARQLHSQSQNLNSIMTKLDQLVSSMSAHWDGTDSTRFHDTYQNQYRTQINNAIQSLEKLANAAITNAQEQRSTSS